MASGNGMFFIRKVPNEITETVLQRAAERVREACSFFAHTLCITSFAVIIYLIRVTVNDLLL